MRGQPGDAYETRAGYALDAVLGDNREELLAQLDAMSTDDLHALHVHAEKLSVRARTEWLNRTRLPRS